MSKFIYEADVEVCWKCQGDKAVRVWVIRKNTKLTAIHRVSSSAVAVPTADILDRTTVQCDACLGAGYRILTVDNRKPIHESRHATQAKD